MARHEVYRVRRRHLRRNDEVAFILAVVVVDEDEHPAVAGFVDDRFRSDEDVGGAALDQPLEPLQRIGGRIPVGLPKLAQAVGVRSRRPGERGAADFASVDDRGQLVDEGG